MSVQIFFRKPILSSQSGQSSAQQRNIISMVFRCWADDGVIFSRCVGVFGVPVRPLGSGFAYVSVYFQEHFGL